MHILVFSALKKLSEKNNNLIRVLSICIGDTRAMTIISERLQCRLSFYSDLFSVSIVFLTLSFGIIFVHRAWVFWSVRARAWRFLPVRSRAWDPPWGPSTKARN